MRSRGNMARRGRLVAPGVLVALIAGGLGALGALHVGARGVLPEPAQPGRGDALEVAYLQALLETRPWDEATRLRLTRGQLALGRYAGAEHTLAPLLTDGSVPRKEAALLALEVAVAAWRASRVGTPERADAEARALRLLAPLSGRDLSPTEVAQVATVARELGRPDLAARASEKAGTLDREGCVPWLTQAARDFLAARDQRRAATSLEGAYRCANDPHASAAMGLRTLDAYLEADMGGEALRLVDLLVERFPADRAILERALGIALAQEDRGRARRLGALLIGLGAADAASLRRQLDLDLAAGDLGGAVDVAKRLVEHAPADPSWRLTAASVATWAGRSRLALRHWRWLARRGDARAVDEALGIARAIQDGAAIAELLTMQGRARPLSSASLAELARALESVGSSGRAVAALQDHAARHPGSRVAWEELATQQERARGFAAALGTRSEIARRFGSSVANSMHLARLHGALGHRGDALAEVRGWVDLAALGEAEYWELLGELAWDQAVDDVARRAYGALWQSGRIDAVGAERLLLLSRAAGRHDDVLRYGRQGWSRFREPRLLLLAMDEAARAGRWNDLAQLADEGARAMSAFADLPAYWLLRGRLDERAGRIQEAVEDYRRALAVDPNSAAARSALIWLFAGAHDREALSRCLAAWAADAWEEPALWRAYAAGLEQLGRRREALAFYEREARADPGDEEAVTRYAGALALAAAASVPGAHEGGAGAVAFTRARVVAGLGVEAVGPMVLQRQRLAARSEVLGAELEARGERIGFTSTDPSLRRATEEADFLLRATFPALGGRTEVAGGVRLRSDADVLQAGLAHARALSSFAEGRIEASLREPATESAAFRMEAVRTRLGGALTLAAGSLYARGGADWRSWATRAGAAVGSGAATTVEVGLRTRSDAPEVRLRLEGGYQRNSLVTPAPAVLAASVPGALLPGELAALGLGATAARWTVGPAQLTADAWLGWVSPPVRPAFRAQAGIAMAPFREAELSLTGFVANDRFGGGGHRGASVSLAYRFGR